MQNAELDGQENGITYIFIDAQDNKNHHSKCCIENGKRILKVFSPTFLVKVDGHQAKTPTHKIQEKDGTQLEQNETVSKEFNFSVTEFLVGNLTYTHVVAR